MSKILNEMEFEDYIIDKLVKNNGFIQRTNDNFLRQYAIDKDMLFKFLVATQPEKIISLKKIYKDKFEETLLNTINNSITQSSLLAKLKNGVDIGNTNLSLLYTKPATSFNKELNKKYSQNIFSVAKEIWASDKERVDLVIFINGFAVISFELKCNAAGQRYEDAIKQYRLERDPKTRLFLFKSGCIVNFAMDLEEAHMTTKLCGPKTYFLPFNKGKGYGIETGHGNPLNKEGFGVSYMWEDILQKDHLIEILSKFVFLEQKTKTVNGKEKITENIIFPRYHQLDCIRKTLEDVIDNKTSLNYLIQHSAGSGKTYTIAWLAHRLATFHDKEDKTIYDNIIVVTDRVIVDRQLQDAITSIDHKSGLIRVMDKKCSSGDLKKAIEGNTKIIVTTIQKFLYIADAIEKEKGKRFAVIIDEAHSSTSGKDMAAVTKSLGEEEQIQEEDDEKDIAETIFNEIKAHRKQKNVSMFAFTATPKATTLRLFGHLNSKGQYEAFHLYSMKQAIEEGFILDVLQNFIPYETFYKINKAIEEDPKYKSKLAKKKIARFALLHDTNISQRIEIIIEHFRDIVLKEQPWAKGMVVTGSRVEAVKYFKAFEKYIERKGYTDVKPLVAFTGKITERQLEKGGNPDKIFTEANLNGFSDDATADKFDTDLYQVLLVANKFQTGFDQPKLSSMYVLKKLKGINAVQTLSRLNRIYLNKKVFVLDFCNTIEEIEKAFKPYYTTTLLCNTLSPELVYKIENKIDGYYIFSNDDSSESNKLFYDKDLAAKTKEEKITFFLSKAKRNWENLSDDDKIESLSTLRKFVRFYEFLLQATSFNDANLHQKYNFITWLLPYLKIGKSGEGFDLRDKIQASNFFQKRGKEIKKTKITPNPNLSLPSVESFKLKEDEEKKLSQIIEEVNSRTGKSFDNDVAIKAALQIRDLMKKDPDVIASAKTNTLKNFELALFSAIDAALVNGLEQNEDFFTLLLKDEHVKKEVLGIFAKNIYEDLKK